MTGLEALVKGLILGVSIAAPVGPIGILCMRRTLESGVLAGVAGGLGTALADAAYAAVAAFGVAGVAVVLEENSAVLNAVGMVVLLGLAVRTARAPVAEGDRVDVSVAEGGDVRRRGVVSLCLATFVLTVTNPMTIGIFAALFAGLGLGLGDGDSSVAALLVIGVFSGSMLWWVVLSFGVSLIRHRLSPAVLRGINLAAALVLFGFAVLMAVTLVRDHGAVLRGFISG